ncbi:MAG: ABC transporter permease subunit [Saprospiraceae bacterium]|nr:ABC transporter permease subunit [Saprospiraceae bacterium]
MNILHLLKLEYIKFRYSAIIKFLLLLFVVLFPFLILGGKDIFVNVPPPLPSNSVFYEFPTVWEYQGYIGNWLLFFFVGFIGIFIVTNEVTFKTLRQNIITGLTRQEYFMGKLLMIITLAIISTIIYAVSSIIIGLIHTPGADMALIFDNNWSITKFFLMAMGYLSFGLFIGFLIRRSGLATFFYLAYIMFLEPIIKWSIFGVLNWDTLQDVVDSGPEGGVSVYNFVNYLPMNVIEDLHPNPFFRFPDNFLKGNDDINYDILITHEAAIIGSVIYISLFIFLAYKSFMSRDI